jgi:hypothetical protein
MGKLLAIVAVAGLVAGGGTYALVYHSDAFGPDPVDPIDCPVVKVGGCPYCTGGAPAASAECESATAAACCADSGTVARATGGETSAAVAVAGPAGLFVSTKAAKKSCCCCEEETTSGLTAVVGAAAVAGK